jgi:hypothetical protein
MEKVIKVPYWDMVTEEQHFVVLPKIVQAPIELKTECVTTERRFTTLVEIFV